MYNSDYYINFVINLPLSSIFLSTSSQPSLFSQRACFAESGSNFVNLVDYYKNHNDELIQYSSFARYTPLNN